MRRSMLGWWLSFAVIAAVLMWPFVGMSNERREPAPPNAAALLVQQADIKALRDHEHTVDEVREKLASGRSFTDARLRYLRRQLEVVYLDLDARSKKYKQRIRSARDLIAEFSQSQTESEKSKDAQFKIEYDPFYLEKIREFKREIAFYEGRLLQIRLLEYKITAIMRNITRIRMQVNNSGIFQQSAPFYQASTWSDGIKQIVGFTNNTMNSYAQLIKQMSHQQQWVGFWCLVVLAAFVLIAYYRFVIMWLQRLHHGCKPIDTPLQNSSAWLLDVVCKGWLPAIFIVVVLRLCFEWFGVNSMPLLLNLFRSVGNAIAFILVAGSMVYASCLHYRYQGQMSLRPLATPMLLFVYQFAAVLFINNINIFTVGGKAYPFYPAMAVDVINCVLAITIFVNLAWVFKRMRSLMRSANDE